MKFIKKNLKWITIIIVMIIAIGLVGLKYTLLSNQATIPNKEEKDNSIILEEKEKLPLETTATPEIKKFFVDIKGAVKKPGVYEVEESKKVIDVIGLAGGFTDSADSTLINLAKKVEDEMVIIIYTKEEVKKATTKDTIVKVVDKECICPEIRNDACLNQKKEETTTPEKNLDKININKASLEELLTLSGIGESKAQAIIEYRTTKGAFKKIEDLLEVSGIGEALFEKIKENITV